MKQDSMIKYYHVIGEGKYRPIGVSFCYNPVVRLPSGVSMNLQFDVKYAVAKSSHLENAYSRSDGRDRSRTRLALYCSPVAELDENVTKFCGNFHFGVSDISGLPTNWYANLGLVNLVIIEKMLSWYLISIERNGRYRSIVSKRLESIRARLAATDKKVSHE